MIKRLNCINITSKNPQKLAEFYVAIGVSVFVHGDSFDGFNFGNAEKETTICVWDENRWGKQKGDFIILVFDADDLEKTYQELKEKGIDIAPPQTTDWGGKKLLLNDPDGNEIMIL